MDNLCVYVFEVLFDCFVCGMLRVGINVCGVVLVVINGFFFRSRWLGLHDQIVQRVMGVQGLLSEL